MWCTRPGCQAGIAWATNCLCKLIVPLQCTWAAQSQLLTALTRLLYLVQCHCGHCTTSGASAELTSRAAVGLDWCDGLPVKIIFKFNGKCCCLTCFIKSKCPGFFICRKLVKGHLGLGFWVNEGYSWLKRMESICQNDSECVLTHISCCSQSLEKTIVYWQNV